MPQYSTAVPTVASTAVPTVVPTVVPTASMSTPMVVLPEAVPQTKVPEDPVEMMRKLRAMTDGGLIDQGQYERQLRRRR